MEASCRGAALHSPQLQSLLVSKTRTCMWSRLVLSFRAHMLLSLSSWTAGAGLLHHGGHMWNFHMFYLLSRRSHVWPLGSILTKGHDKKVNWQCVTWLFLTVEKQVQTNLAWLLSPSGLEGSVLLRLLVLCMQIMVFVIRMECSDLWLQVKIRKNTL